MAQDGTGFKLIRAARIMDGRGGPPLERGALLIEGSAVRAVGPEESVAPPEGARVEEYDYPNHTVLPGLIDAHTHLNGFGDGRSGDQLVQSSDDILLLQSERNARAHLHTGVTTIRDCGAKGRTVFSLRQAIQMGITEGPRLVLAGRPVAITGGHLWWFGSEADGVDGVRKAVRQLVKEGADYIKITATGGSTGTSLPLRPSFNVDELRAIVEEAHKFGRLTAAHCVSTQGIINCLDAGVDMLIHCVFREPDGSYNFREDVAERIARQGVWVNPTLAQGMIRLRALQDKAQEQGLTERERLELEQMKVTCDSRMEHFGRMVALGVKMACGSDSSWAWYPMGSFQHEVAAHAQGGMGNMKAILSATRDNAVALDVHQKVGTLEPGKEADVLVVEGDPLEDIKHLWKVSAVFQAGRPVEQARPPAF